MQQRSIKSVAESNLAAGVKPASSATLKLPKSVVTDTFVQSQPKRCFANAHAYHINSISINSDGETFLSADDLRVNLWNFNISETAFSACSPHTTTL